jgi:hypothetical protein
LFVGKRRTAHVWLAGASAHHSRAYQPDFVVEVKRIRRGTAWGLLNGRILKFAFDGSAYE